MLFSGLCALPTKSSCTRPSTVAVYLTSSFALTCPKSASSPLVPRATDECLQPRCDCRGQPHEQPCPIVLYFDALARDEHKRAIVNRYPDSVALLRSLQAENTLLKETLAAHSPEQVTLLRATRAENEALKERMAKRSQLAATLEEGCRYLRDM